MFLEREKVKNQFLGKAVLVGALLTGCGIYQTKSQPTISPDLSAIVADPNAPVPYAMVRDAVFSASCTRCHGATKQSDGIRLDSYADVMAHIEGVKGDIADKSMPEDSALTDDQIAVFNKWISQGAPLNASDAILSATPTPAATPVSASPTPAPAVGSWAAVSEAVFKPSCIKCHGSEIQKGDVRLDSNDSAESVWKDIQFDVFEDKSMPEEGTLTDAQLSVLSDWIKKCASDAGDSPTPTPSPSVTPVPSATPVSTPVPTPMPTATPEPSATPRPTATPAPTATPEPSATPHPSITPAPTPTATPEPTATPRPTPVIDPTPTPVPALTATYMSIKTNIFDAKCMVCHNPSGRAAKVPLFPYAEMMKVKDLVIPGDMNKSSLLISTSKGSMPPKRSNIPPLTADELQAIQTWISNGAAQ